MLSNYTTAAAYLAYLGPGRLFVCSPSPLGHGRPGRTLTVADGQSDMKDTSWHWRPCAKVEDVAPTGAQASIVRRPAAMDFGPRLLEGWPGGAPFDAHESVVADVRAGFQRTCEQ